MTGYPLELDVRGRRTIVVGGGQVALRRVRCLVDAGAQVTVIAPEISEELAALAVTLVRRRYRDGDLAGAWLVHAASDDPAVNERVAAAAEHARTWCVRADNAGESAAWTPAVVRHGDITVAVTAGGDPRRAQRLRTAIGLALAEGRLPLRRIRRRPGHGHVRPDYDPAECGLADPGQVDRGQADGRQADGRQADGRQADGRQADGRQADGRIAGQGRPEFARVARPGGTGRVALVGGGPGDPGLITVRGRRLLAEADVVVADRLGPRGLLAELDPDTEIIEAGKSPGAHSLTQDQINALIVDRALAGNRVVRLKGGDPFVFGRGGEEALACVRAGVPVEVVPGVSSAVAVPAAAGIPVTHRGITQDFSVISAHLDPSAPGATVDWEALAGGTGTLVLLMAVTQLDTIAAELIKRGRDAATPAAVIRDGTTASQQVLISRLDQVAADAARYGIRPPAVIVIGDVVRLSEQLGGAAGVRPGELRGAA